MNIKQFKSIVDLLSKIAPKKCVIPILNNVRVSIQDNTLRLTASDMESTIYIDAPIEQEQPEQIERLIHIDTLKTLAKGKKDIDFTVRDNNIFLNQLPCKDFSEEYPADEALFITAEIIPDNFSERLKLIQPGIQKRGDNAIRFSCFNMEYNGMESDCNLITTDGQQLLISRNLSSNDNKKALIIGTLIPLLEKINPEKILIGNTTNNDDPDRVQFKAQLSGYSVTITTRIIVDVYPDWRRIIPEKLEYKMTFSKQVLSDSFQSQKLQDTLEPDQACDKIEIDFSTFKLRTIFSKLEKLVNFAIEDITIQTNGVNHPLIISYPEYVTYTAILVSLRPKED